MAQVRPNYIRIHGLITPADWDEKGNIITLSIATFDEDEYLVLHDNISEPMMLLLYKTVEVDGIVSRLNSRNQIKVKTFRLIKPNG